LSTCLYVTCYRDELNALLTHPAGATKPTKNTCTYSCSAVNAQTPHILFFDTVISKEQTAWRMNIIIPNP